MENHEEEITSMHSLCTRTSSYFSDVDHNLESKRKRRWFKSSCSWWSKDTTETISRSKCQTRLNTCKLRMQNSKWYQVIRANQWWCFTAKTLWPNRWPLSLLTLIAEKLLTEVQKKEVNSLNISSLRHSNSLNAMFLRTWLKMKSSRS